MCFLMNKSNRSFSQIDSEVYQNNFVKNNEYSLMNPSEEGVTYFILAMTF